LAKFEKRLSKLYEQLLKSKSSSYKNTFKTTVLLYDKALRLVVWSVNKLRAANSDKRC